MDELPSIKLCVAYKYNQKELTEFPSDIDVLEKCEPVYEEFPGWKADTTKARSFEELPANARKYLDRISKIAGVPISLISIGAERGKIIRL
jgi:adenylosuccinate synthase